MILEAETMREAVRFRSVRCECVEGCPTRFFAASIGELWLAFGVWDDADLETVADDVMAQPEAVVTLAHGVTLCGAPWPWLLSQAFCVRQLAAWSGSPDWMARVPIKTVHAVRSCLVGSDPGRVVRALYALEEFGPQRLQEQPVPAGSMEALLGRQVRLSYAKRSRS